MAKKITRPKRPAPKRSAAEQALLTQQRALERERNTRRRIVALTRQLHVLIDRSHSSLCSLARQVFDTDADFRATLIAAELHEQKQLELDVEAAAAIGAARD